MGVTGSLFLKRSWHGAWSQAFSLPIAVAKREEDLREAVAKKPRETG